MLNLQKIADMLSAQKGIPYIEVQMRLAHQMRNADANGECLWQKGIIKINTSVICTDMDLVIAVFHEWRHWWQYYRYQEHFLFWMNSQNQKWYRTVYYTQLCTIEEDARIFSYSLGAKSLEFLLRKSIHHLIEERDLHLTSRGEVSDELQQVLPELEKASQNRRHNASKIGIPRYNMYLSLYP